MVKLRRKVTSAVAGVMEGSEVEEMGGRGEVLLVKMVHVIERALHASMRLVRVSTLSVSRGS